MAFFRDAKEIIFIDYPEKGKTINGQYYAESLQCLKDEVKNKRQHLTKKKKTFFTMATHLPINRSFRWLKSTNWNLNCSLNYLITRFSPNDYRVFSNIKNCSGAKKLTATKKSSMPYTSISMNLMNRTVKIISPH